MKQSDWNECEVGLWAGFAHKGGRHSVVDLAQGWEGPLWVGSPHEWEAHLGWAWHKDGKHSVTRTGPPSGEAMNLQGCCLEACILCRIN
eukprot:1152288-Pelagomonas_calceolata.AAC.7